MIADLLASTTACGGEADAPGAGTSASASTASATRGSADTDADMAEIRARTLTMTDVERWYQAQRNVYEAMRRNPSLAQQLQGDESEDSDEMSLDEIEARYAKVPEVRKGIEAAGLEVRDFGVITWTLVQASFASAAIDMGANRDSVLASTGIKPANLDFVRENRARLEQLQAEIAALAPRDADDDDAGGA